MNRFPGDTSIGGADNRFPPTTGGLVARLSFPDGPDHAALLEDFARRYWRPVYHYLRVAWAKPNEEAKDLTQSFFEWLLEKRQLARYEASKGSLRNFLKLLLKTFVSHADEALRSAKRGGGSRLLSLSDLDAAGELPGPAPGGDPEAAYDRAWFALFMRNAVARVRDRFQAEGREIAFRVFEAYDLSPRTPDPSYAGVASELGISAIQVQNHLALARGEIRREIRAELSALTADDRGLDEEWNALFG